MQMQSTSKLRTTVNVAAPTAVLARVEVILSLHPSTNYSCDKRYIDLLREHCLSVKGTVQIRRKNFVSRTF